MTNITTGMPLFRTELRLGKYTAAASERLEQLDLQDFAERLWKKDHTLWKRDDAARKSITSSLGWVNVVEKMLPAVNGLVEFANEIKEAGFTHAVVMGMGGSSLAPLVMQNTLADLKGLKVRILDTTDAETVKAVDNTVTLGSTLFIVASKSGTTAEPNAFLDYFYARMQDVKGNKAGDHFIAITDPNTAMLEIARKKNFRQTFLNYSDIGGRYSALSYFGLVPAVLMGIDVKKLLELAMDMVKACGPAAAVKNNPGLVLGSAIGELARQGRDKLTLIMPKEISSLGLWLEQLTAESTGKEDKGILPVSENEIHEPDWYGEDRVFVYIDMPVTGSDKWRTQLDALTEAGHPVIILQMNSPYSLGQEFYRWETAIAAAGAVLGINPFDQPNVQESKDCTNRIIEKVRAIGRLPEATPALTEGPLSFFTSAKASEVRTLMEEFFVTVRPKDYIAILAYLAETPGTSLALETLRDQLQKKFRVPVTIGYGPRFLHSTGQYHKGGPNTGVFLQLTAKDTLNVPIPGRNYSFDTFKNAQALGDMEALQAHRRRVMRIDLGDDTAEGLASLKLIFETALGTGERSSIAASVA
jgi:transaldolase / glucose-6-phosphate isomerase